VGGEPDRKPPALRPKRQRARGVDHHHLGARRRIGERTHQVRQADTLDRNVAFAGEPRVDAEQEILALERERMSGEIDEGQRLGTGRLDLAEKLAIALDEIRLAEIAALDDLEAQAAQRFRNQARVVERIRDRAGTVGGIADHEGDARLGLLLRLQRDGARASQRHRGEREQE
jgi:hypothetical protein